MRTDGIKESQIKGELHMHGKFIRVDLFVILFEDNGTKVAYCPALNVYGYGRDEQEARESFEICLKEFFDYTIKKKTFAQELESLGWNVKRKKKFIAPAFSQLLEKNKTLKKVMDTKDFKKVSAPIRIPAIA